ncbi:MAG TPA: hypothetical protein VK698_31130 [Kofleriaceae bacterium]|nr:hypothetical protein [Kofleriaceae bacterium]
MADKFKPDNQGEGNRDAARRYNQEVEKHAHSGLSDQAAEKAREDVDGPGGEALRQAERDGKKHIAEEDPEVEGSARNDERTPDPTRPGRRAP